MLNFILLTIQIPSSFFGVFFGGGGGTCEVASPTLRCEIQRKLHIIMFFVCDDLVELSHKVVGLF